MVYVPVPIPIPASVGRAVVPGAQGLLSSASETISMPMVALAVAAGMALYHYPTSAKTLAKQSAGTCQTRYCRPAEMFVDTLRKKGWSETKHTPVSVLNPEHPNFVGKKKP